jgi:hypothetical protein
MKSNFNKYGLGLNSPMTLSSLRFPLLITAAFASLANLHGQTVAWGTSASVNPLSFNSDGAVDNSSNTWTLGWFNVGYTPTDTNWDSWADNWNPVATSVHQDWGGFWAVSVNTYDVGVDAAGKQMYVFAYNDLNKIGTPDGEVLIYRQDGLLFPSIPNQETFDIADNPLDAGDDAFTVIWGRVDRNMYADNLWPNNAASPVPENGGVLTGGGIFSVLMPDSVSVPYDQGNGTFEAQFGTWAVIPEPSTALLGGLGMMLLLRRRR